MSASATATTTIATPVARTPLSNGQILRLIRKGFSDRQIARQAGCSRQNISRRRKGLWVDLDRAETNAYRANEALLLDDTKRIVLSELRAPKRLEKASARDLAIIYGVLFDKGQLAKGQSTANLSLHVLVEQVERERRTPTGSVQLASAAISDSQVPIESGESS